MGEKLFTIRSRGSVRKARMFFTIPAIPWNAGSVLKSSAQRYHKESEVERSGNLKDHRNGGFMRT